MKRIARVEHLIDGYVEVFDEDGDHMPEYEGHSLTAIPKILATGWREGIPIVGRRRGEKWSTKTPPR